LSRFIDSSADLLSLLPSVAHAVCGFSVSSAGADLFGGTTFLGGEVMPCVKTDGDVAKTPVTPAPRK
jgi:hypothetical protein